MKKSLLLAVLLIFGIAKNVFATTCLINGETVPCSDMPPWFVIIFLIVPVITLVFGTLFVFSRPFIEWSIKFNNKLRGVKTEITPVTIKYYRIAGLFAVIFSIFFFTQVLNIFR